jgi:SAM-dependent methyltransferase
MATQADVESPWFVHWCDAMRCQPLYHRKLWELASVVQVLFEHGKLAEGSHGIGFGCGEEPLASLFASLRATVVISDLEGGAAAERGWVDTGQHAGSLAQAFKPDICDRVDFDAYVSHRTIDMTDIPRDLDGAYDFCWSVCAMEHLGDIESGLNFVERSLDVLRPGGVAVHTTEFNHLGHEPNVVTGPTVYYREADIRRLAEHLSGRGARLLGPDFSIGDGVLDRYVDVPPFQLGEGLMHAEPFGAALQLAHLKVALDGIPCTCYRIVIVKDP